MSLPTAHLLSLPRPDVFAGPQPGAIDTTTLAAHDFDVDTRTGFMPPDPPIARLPEQWEQWENLLDDAQKSRLQLGRRPDLTEEEMARSESWRARVRQTPIIPSSELSRSEFLLRRAHCVLAWLMHFYIHSQPPAVDPSSNILIPPPIAIPLLQISTQLNLPPVLTYSDDVLYNWALKTSVPSGTAPALDNLRCITTFTGTPSEEEFYLSSARCELRGVEVLDAMRATMDELFVGDAIARTRITRFLGVLAGVIDDLARVLLSVREGCDPQTFYHDIRPWFNGQDSAPTARKWVFEGVERQPAELSGPSAAQSSLVHALDIFLGVDRYSHEQTARENAGPSFLDRMQTYMPRHHRGFLRHLAAAPRPLRALVEESDDADLRGAYNESVAALKRFRDAHIRVVSMYIITPARREQEARDAPLKGTGGTDLVKFLKGVRDRTAGAIVGVEGEP